MKQVLVLDGSPKAKSDTMRITGAFLRGMTGDGSYEAEIVKVIDRKIAPCRGCFACWKTGDGRCAQDDDQNVILEKFLRADVVIYSFPLYCYGVPSALKASVDRLLPLSKMAMKKVDGRVVHEACADLGSKRIVMISGCGFPSFEDNFRPVRLQFELLFPYNALTELCISEAPMMNARAARYVAEPLLEKLERAGREYAERGALRAETVRELETPMIPEDEYLRQINGG